MKPLLLLFACVLHVATPHGIPQGVTVGLTPYSHPVISLYHSQDNYGQYVYGYSTPTSSKSETKTADGVTRGGYSYIDSNGILQTVEYIADALHGFRVAATNLPRDLPDVAHAKAQHLAQFAAISADHAQARVKYSNPIAVPISQVLPLPVQDLPEVVKARAQHLEILQQAYATGSVAQTVQDLPEVVKARAEHLAAVEATKARNAAVRFSPIPQEIRGAVVPVATALPVAARPIAHASYAPASAQFHAQDLAQYSYGYVGDLSAKAETRGADGVTRGGYSYIDANGVLQTVNYVSDAVNGFRVAATNLPVAPKTTLVAPGPVTVVRHGPVIGGLNQKVLRKTGVPSVLYTQDIVY